MKKHLLLLPLISLMFAVPSIAATTAPVTTHHGDKLAKGGHRGYNEYKELNLTPTQQAQEAQIKADAKTQLERIITPQQKQAYKDAIAAKKTKKEAKAAMNISADQKAQMKAIMKASQEKFVAILTPEQKAKLTSMKGKKHHGVKKNEVK